MSQSNQLFGIPKKDGDDIATLVGEIVNSHEMWSDAMKAIDDAIDPGTPEHDFAMVIAGRAYRMSVDRQKSHSSWLETLLHNLIKMD